jgi:hypothetical protein
MAAKLIDCKLRERRIPDGKWLRLSLDGLLAWYLMHAHHAYHIREDGHKIHKKGSPRKARAAREREPRRGGAWPGRQPAAAADRQPAGGSRVGIVRFSFFVRVS